MGEEPRRKTDHRRMEQLVVLESRSLGKDGQGVFNGLLPAFHFFFPASMTIKRDAESAERTSSGRGRLALLIGRSHELSP
jgi:hypothetical protein